MSVTGKITINETNIYELDSDPSSSIDTNAPLGSLAVTKDANPASLWQKFDSNIHDWKLMQTAIDQKILQGYNSVNSSNIGSLAATVIFNNTRNESNGEWSLNNTTGELTYLKTGLYLIQAEISIGMANTSRTKSRIWLEKNSVEISGTRGSLYHRTSSQGTNTATITFLDNNASINDVIRVRGQRISGNGNLRFMANGCRLTIQKIIKDN